MRLSMDEDHISALFTEERKEKGKCGMNGGCW